MLSRKHEVAPERRINGLIEGERIFRPTGPGDATDLCDYEVQSEMVREVVLPRPERLRPLF